MKKFLILGIFCVLAGCASTPRRPASSIFTCHFKAQIEGAEKKFEFVPDDHSLLVDKEDVALEESDFAAGSFVYKTKGSETKWNGELIFTSYDKDPQIYLKLEKSPLSNQEIVINTVCE